MNLAVNSAPGGNNDPVGSSSDPRAHAAMTVYLQAAISVFKNDPHIYNLTSYLICGTLLLIWGGWTFYQRASSANSLLALAAVSALTMLPTYHRQHDTSLLVLAVPACALLWAQGGMVARAALSITTACALLTSNLVLQFLGYLTMPLWFRGAGLSRAIWTVLLARPATLALLALGCFYLWVYVRNSFHLRSGVKLEDNSVAALVTSA